MKQLSFMVQSLDNVSPGLMVAEGKTLAESDALSRRKLASKIGLEMMKAETVFSENGVTAMVTSESFFIKVQTNEFDQIGRKAPILAMGEIPDAFHDEVMRLILNDLLNFANRSNRTIETQVFESVRNAMNSINERIQVKKKLFTYLLVILISILIGCLMFWMIQSQ